MAASAFVAAVVPTFNRAHTLPRALSSILKQSRPVDDVIVVDDGSTDNTAAIACDFPDVTWLGQNNSGVSAARNHGIRAATSHFRKRFPDREYTDLWIALLDSDDEWQPHRVERQLDRIAAINDHVEPQPDYRLVHSDEVWVRNGVRVNPMKKHEKTGGWIYQRCLPLCVISPSASLIRRDLFDDRGLFDETLPACEDYDLWLRVCAHEPVLYIDEQLIVKYGGHDDQLSQKHWGMDRFRIKALSKMLRAEELNDEQRAATLDMLTHKLSVMETGARKRANTELVTELAQVRNEFDLT